MRKSFIMMGRYTLLMMIAMAAGVALISLASMPAWMARAGGVVGAGWLALRYVMWRTSQ